ncbi:MAG: cell wall-binding repeat-containing protein, partial [Nitriliruptorales bacterium]
THADALAAAPIAAARGDALLLVNGRNPRADAQPAAWLGQHREEIDTVRAVGGTGAVTGPALRTVAVWIT